MTDEVPAQARHRGERDRAGFACSSPSARPWISVTFDCCGIYQRVYLNSRGTAYVGWCPRCARRVEARVSPVGTTCRFFRAR